MTGPEAIAAAERLLKSITPGKWRSGAWRDSYRIVEGQAFDCSWKVICEHVRAGTPEQADGNVDFIAAAPELVATLRAALLQSQEALVKIAHRGRDGYWLDTDGPDVIARAILLSPPVAPKEPCD